jgi:DNA replication initiation complex subunit (GINS family)
MYPSLFDSFFNPPTIVVVSEERLRTAEREQKQRQLTAVDERLKQLREYRQELAKDIDKLNQPQSLEEALTGE